MKGKDILSAALEELARSFPQLKSILIDERDRYLAQKSRPPPAQGGGRAGRRSYSRHQKRFTATMTWMSSPKCLRRPG